MERTLNLGRFRLPAIAGLYGAGDALVKGGQYILLIWLATRLSKSEYAILIVAVGFMQLISVALLGGLPEALYSLFGDVRFKNSELRLFNAVNTYQYLFAIIISIPTIALYYFLKDSNLRGISWPIIPIIYLNAFFVAKIGILTVIKQVSNNHRSAIIYRYLLPGAGLILVVFGIVIFGNRYEIYFAGNVFGMIILFLFLSRSNNSLTLSKIDKELFRDLSRLGLPLLLVAFCGWLSGFGLTVILGGMISNDVIAQYGIIISINAMLLMFYNAFNQVWVPRFFQEAKNKSVEKLDYLNALANDLLNLSVISIIIFVYLFSKEFLNLLNMSEYKDVPNYLGIVFLSHFFIFFHYRYVNYYFLIGKNATYSLMVITSGLIGLALTIGLVSRFPNSGIYFGYTISISIRTIIVVAYIFVTLRKRFLEYVPIIGLIVFPIILLLNIQDSSIAIKTCVGGFILPILALYFRRTWKTLISERL